MKLAHWRPRPIAWWNDLTMFKATWRRKLGILSPSDREVDRMLRELYAQIERDADQRAGQNVSTGRRGRYARPNL